MTVEERADLLKFEGTGRNVLEARIVALVRVLDAASELVSADDAAQAAIALDEPAGDVDADARYELAWERLRAALASL